MAIVRAHVERVEQLGLDEAYLDLTGLVAPKAAMRRLVHEIRAADRARRVGRHRPQPARGEGRERRREARRVRRADARAGVRALRRRAAARWCPGSGPRTAERLTALGITTLGELAAADEELLAATFGAAPGAVAAARRARFEGSSEIEPVREAVSESRETTFDYDIADRRGSSRSSVELTRAALRGPAAQRAARADDRDQGAARRLDDGHARADDRRARPTTSARSGEVGARAAARVRAARGRCGCSACASRPSRDGGDAPAHGRRRRWRCRSDRRRPACDIVRA